MCSRDNLQTPPAPEWCPNMVEKMTAVENAIASGRLLESSASNIRRTLESASSAIAAQAIAELVEADEWTELNDRFFRSLAFGTGGIRGRTIGKVVTRAERGTPNELGRPEFPCVGSNAMNYDSISRATQGLTDYLREWFAREKLERPSEDRDRARHPLLLGGFHKTRGRSRGPKRLRRLYLPGPRSTPELSFAVRYLRANAGVVVTASHNPSHDNGYKVYFGDGAQVVEPHASGIIAKVNAVGASSAPNETSRAKSSRLATRSTRLTWRGSRPSCSIRELVRSQRDLRIVYTPIHGTGGVIIKPMLERLGFNFEVVAEQDRFDGRFPTVQSPNPENAEALEAGDRAGDEARRRSRDRDRSGLRSHGRGGAERSGRNEIADRQPDRFAHRLLPGEDAFRPGRAQRRKTQRAASSSRHLSRPICRRRSRKNLACAASKR